MVENEQRNALEEAIRHAGAGHKALEGAMQSLADSGHVYPTHIYLATVELAHAIETAMKIVLRNQ